MAVAVVVIPGGFVGVVGVVGDEALHDLGHIGFDEAGFEFHCRQGGGAAYYEEV